MTTDNPEEKTTINGVEATPAEAITALTEAVKALAGYDQETGAFH